MILRTSGEPKEKREYELYNYDQMECRGYAGTFGSFEETTSWLKTYANTPNYAWVKKWKIVVHITNTREFEINDYCKWLLLC